MLVCFWGLGVGFFKGWVGKKVRTGIRLSVWNVFCDDEMFWDGELEDVEPAGYEGGGAGCYDGPGVGGGG